MTQVFIQRYFVRELDEKGFRPVPEAAFEIQILNSEGIAELCAYIARSSDNILALVHAMKGRIPVDSYPIPPAVIDAARQRRVGFGEYVNEKGEILRPSFLRADK